MGRVSVVIPSHNCANLLPCAVESVMRQTCKNWQLCIIDDGSTDGTSEYTRTLKHPDVHVIRNDKPAGPAVARNQGILASNSEFVAFLDADDEWAPEKLASQLDCLRENTESVLCFTDYTRLNGDGSQEHSALAGFPDAAEGMIFKRLLKQNFVLTSSVVVRRDALSRSGLFDQRLRYCQDYDLWLRVSRVGPFCLVPESLSIYRIHGDNNVLSDGYAMLQPLFLEIALDKHDDASEARKLMRGKLGRAWHHRGRTAMRDGNFAVSRTAFWRAARYGNSPFKNLLRAGWSLMPSFISRPRFSGTQQAKNPQAAPNRIARRVPG